LPSTIHSVYLVHGSARKLFKELSSPSIASPVNRVSIIHLQNRKNKLST